MEELPFIRSDAIAVPNPRILVPRSTMCDVVIVKTGRYKYLQSLLGSDMLDEYDPWAIKAAVDGTYHTARPARFNALGRGGRPSRWHAVEGREEHNLRSAR